MDTLRRWRNRTAKHLNFYRIHLLVFTFVPLIVTIIFWASNTDRDHVSFIDALFICVSSMTVTGLATINLSPLSAWQQVILFFLMIVGHPVTVSWIIVYIRRSYFRRKFGDVILERMRSRAEKDGLPLHPDLQKEVEVRADGRWKYYLRKFFGKRGKDHGHSKYRSSSSASKAGSSTPDSEIGHSRITIRRMDNAPQLVNPSGWISEGRAPPRPLVPSLRSPPPDPTRSALKSSPRRRAGSLLSDAFTTSQMDHTAEGPAAPPPQPAEEDQKPAPKPETATTTGYFPRTQTVEFATPAPRLNHHARKGSFAGGLSTIESPPTEVPNGIRRSLSRPDLDRKSAIGRSSGVEMPRSNTMMSNRTRRTTMWESQQPRYRDRGFGGFPGPIDVITGAVKRLLPDQLEQRVQQVVTMPRTETLISQLNAAGGSVGGQARTVPYLRFDTVVGRNSVFHDLTQEKLEELGGVEYRALTALLWIVGAYHLLFPLVLFVIIAPYVSQSEYKSVFSGQLAYVNPVWFAAFQSVSAYTNTGTSLCDTSMVPFRMAYTMIIPMFITIIAGNTGFPIFLRLVIWLLTKIVPSKSMNETLHFLLDHPRRCYIYLFPSHQTWFLFTVLVLMVLTDWVSFLVLDIGTPEIMEIPVGTRFAVGLLQAGAVRAAGFAAISLNALAPAVKVLYVTMMYVAVYPIALSVRSTNVYEEKSLGIFEAEDQDDDMEPDDVNTASRASVWSRYLYMHARKQLAFDIWWLGLALWLVCIIERGPLTDLAQQSWFNIFSVLFELVSAYGTVGLSLGIPDQNYSFSGALSTLSKLIVIMVMLRGRHRGLPVAIDRAVLLKGDDFPDSLENEAPGGIAMQRFDTTTEPHSRGRTGEPRRPLGHHQHHPSLGGNEKPENVGGMYSQTAALASYLMEASPQQKEKEREDQEDELARQSPERLVKLHAIHEGPATRPSSPQDEHEEEDNEGGSISHRKRVFDL